MSTKIYNGYKFKKAPDLNGVHEFCLKLRDKVKPIAEKLYVQTLLTLMVGTYDRNQFGFYDESMYFIGNGDLYWGVEQYLFARMQELKSSQRRDPAIDFEFEICILPKKGGEVLILLYTEQPLLKKAFSSMDEIEDYHYQDQSDKPNKISNEKWKKREDDWCHVLGGDGWGVPSEYGFTYKPYVEDRFVVIGMDKKERKRIMKYVPSISLRANAIARQQEMNQWYADNPPIVNEKGTDKYWEYMAYTKTDDHKKSMTERIETITPQLKEFKEFSDFNVQLIFSEKTLEIIKSKEGGKPSWYTGKR